MCLNCRMHKGLVITFLLSASLWLLTGCAKPIPTPGPTPAPPAYLQDLPQTARAKPLWTVWELPGYPPIDPESDISPYNGEYLGATIESEVLVLDYAWSEAGAEFYVRVRQAELEGWVPLRAIVFDQ